ncbi:MAG TPA: LemA family protein [Acidobacteriaceae bacterium]|nr:LemA family protein [Acidobacteriaceae bacterium]
MKALWAVLGVVGLILLVVIFSFVSYVGAKNTMVEKNATIDQAFSNIDVDLQRRADLIPNLVASVKGYANVEETVLKNISDARAGLLQARTPDEKLAANDRLSVALLPFTRMAENYPQLKSNDQFMRLEDELAGTENRIAVSRLRYNDAIKDYNVYIQQFPNSIWANIAGFHARNVYYTADQSSREAPKVDFSK